jgi:hypothetical protein
MSPEPVGSNTGRSDQDVCFFASIEPFPRNFRLRGNFGNAGVSCEFYRYTLPTNSRSVPAISSGRYGFGKKRHLPADRLSGYWRGQKSQRFLLAANGPAPRVQALAVH